MQHRHHGLALFLLCTSLILTACEPAALAIADWETGWTAEQSADAAGASHMRRHVYGALHFAETPGWNGEALNLSMDFIEADPSEHTATGALRWDTAAVDPAFVDPAWQKVDAVVTHVYFGADAVDGEPGCLVIIAQVVSAQGKPTVQRGDYAYFWLRDGGPNDPDQWGIFPYAVEPRQEFFPYDRSPALHGYFTAQAMQHDTPWLPLTAATGNIVVEWIGP